VDEIDAGRPAMLFVDSDGDGIGDHSVFAFSYDDRADDGVWYGFYDTWSEDESVRWAEFRPIEAGRAWGVGAVETFVPGEVDFAAVPGGMPLGAAIAGDLDWG
jgi:hypothetical protein